MTGIVVLGRVRRLSLLVGLVFAALPAGSALADTTIGQTGVSSIDCGGGPGAGADTNYVVPAGGGTITSFSFASTAANTNEQVDFLVLQHVSGTSYRVVGKTGPQTLAGTGAVETFPAHISVQAGEILGFWFGTTLHNCVRTVASGGGVLATPRGMADPGLNATLDFPNSSSALDLNESATLVPDADLALTDVPANMTVNATGPLGAVVTYTPPTAVDEDNPPTASVHCDHPSESTFPIATTTVTCTATDADDLNSPVSAHFSVTVKGALAQLQDLLVYVRATLRFSAIKIILGNQLRDAINGYQNGSTGTVCSDLGSVVFLVQFDNGPLTNTQATNILTAANRISAVIGCNQT
jgi:hypothetical protein